MLIIYFYFVVLCLTMKKGVIKIKNKKCFYLKRRHFNFFMSTKILSSNFDPLILLFCVLFLQLIFTSNIFDLKTIKVKMVEIRRYDVSKIVIPSALAQPLQLKTSKKIVKNRFYKPPMSEYTTHFDPDDLKSTGIPTQQLINAYEKWAYGGFGIIVTGAIIMDQMSLNYVPGNMLIGEDEDSLERQKGFEAIAKVSKEHGAIVLAQLANIEDQQGFYKAETEEEKILALKKTIWAVKYVFERGFDGILIQFLPASKDGVVDLELTEKLIETLEKVVRENLPENAEFVMGVKLSTARFQGAGVDYDGFIKVLKKVESCNYDFVELAGGSIEFPLETAASRESLFSQVITSAKPQVPTLTLFATGGFRTVAAMENAITSGSLDGIGLGRPAASEFDFPNKVLQHQIQSAMWSPFEDDMSLGVPAAAAQIAQAGKTGLKETKFDANFGIHNFADEKTQESFMTAKKVRDAEIEALKKDGKLIAGVIQF